MSFMGRDKQGVAGLQCEFLPAIIDRGDLSLQNKYLMLFRMLMECGVSAGLKLEDAHGKVGGAFFICNNISGLHTLKAFPCHILQGGVCVVPDLHFPPLLTIIYYVILRYGVLCKGNDMLSDDEFNLAFSYGT